MLVWLDNPDELVEFATRYQEYARTFDRFEALRRLSEPHHLSPPVHGGPPIVDLLKAALKRKARIVPWSQLGLQNFFSRRGRHNSRARNALYELLRFNYFLPASAANIALV